MKKRVLALVLAGMMAALTACGGAAADGGASGGASVDASAEVRLLNGKPEIDEQLQELAFKIAKENE